MLIACNIDVSFVIQPDVQLVTPPLMDPTFDQAPNTARDNVLSSNVTPTSVFMAVNIPLVGRADHGTVTYHDAEVSYVLLVGLLLTNFNFCLDKKTRLMAKTL